MYSRYKLFNVILGIFKNLSDRRRKQFVLLLILMLLSGLAELFSLAAVIPFMTVLTNPEVIFENQKLIRFLNLFSITTIDNVLALVTIVFLSSVFLAAVIRIFNVWMNVKMTGKIASDLSCNAYKKILYQPYQFHLNNNTSSFIPTITTSINHTGYLLNLFLSFISSVIISLSILFVLVSTNLKVAFSVAFLFLGTYSLIAVLTKKRIKSNSKKISQSMQGQMKALNEGIGSIRDVIMDGNQQFYEDIYKRSDYPLRMQEAESLFWGSAPRFVLEFLGVTFIVIIAYFSNNAYQSSSSVFALLGTFALGGQKLILCLQNVFFAWTGMNTYLDSVSNVISLISKSSFSYNSKFKNIVPFKLKHSISFNNVDFRYGKEKPLIIKNLNFNFFKGERIGIIGKTGSGKSTLVDLIMGLNFPTSGEIHIDDKNLHDALNPDLLQKWRSSISHVPQDIFLADNSFEENIALGVPPKDIEFGRVKKAAEEANIAKFIEKAKYGYKTKIGERGIQLSGGQKQRLGIARAFYKNCNILILDEATSALDKKTEGDILDSIKKLKKEITIFIIAHRLNNVSDCDKIVIFDQDKIFIKTIT